MTYPDNFLSGNIFLFATLFSKSFFFRRPCPFRLFSCHFILCLHHICRRIFPKFVPTFFPPFTPCVLTCILFFFIIGHLSIVSVSSRPLLANLARHSCSSFFELSPNLHFSSHSPNPHASFTAFSAACGC